MVKVKKKLYVKYNNGKHTFTTWIHFISTLQSKVIIKLLLTKASKSNVQSLLPVLNRVWFCLFNIYKMVLLHLQYVLKFVLWLTEITALTVD